MKPAFLPGLILLAAAAPGLASAADLHGPDVAAMDSSVVPGNDFFAYGNGTWIKNTEIPPDRSAYGLSQILADQTTQRVSDILKSAAAHPAKPGSEAQQIGDYYSSFMDEAAIDAKGLKPNAAALKQIDEIFSRRRPRRNAARRRRRAQQHQSLHAAPLRPVGGPGPQ